MKQFIKLNKLSIGDQVAIISPSDGKAGKYPWVFDYGLTCLKDTLELNPIEYPTTRATDASLQDRARDIMAAFEDPSNKAVFATLGGIDQIQLIKYLDPQIFIDNPKPFFGSSDNTHLCNFLWNLGIPSFYGGEIMTQFAAPGGINEITLRSIKHILFENGEFELEISKFCNDVTLDWSDPANLTKTIENMEPNNGLIWDGDIDASGELWGGCTESLMVQFTTGKFLPSNEDMDGKILMIETAGDMPDHWVIQYLLIGLGERGWLDKFQAVLVGRPKTWDFDKQNNLEQKNEYRQKQQQMVLNTVREYNINIPVIQNVDFGHTDPQVVMPLGNMVKIANDSKKIFIKY